MPYGTIAEVLAAFKEVGLFSFYLPFLIVFTILWALFTKTGVFGKDRPGRVINLILSLGISLFIMAYTPFGVTLSLFLAQLFSGSFMLLLVILAILFLFAFVFPALTTIGFMAPGTRGKKGPTMFGKIVLWGVFLFVVVLGIGLAISSGVEGIFPGLSFLGGLGGGTPTPTFVLPGLTTQDIAIIIVVVLTGFIIWWMSRPEGD
jgi:hypothetical protein